MRKYKKRSTIRRSRTGARSARPEVKIYTAIYEDFAIYSSFLNADSTSIPASANLYPDLLDGIIKGTTSSQRVGDRIFVKKIQYSGVMFLCPSGNSTSMNTALVRLVICGASWGKASGTSIQYFFDRSLRRVFNGPLNRRRFPVFKDKIISFQSGWPATTDSDGDLDSATGQIKHFNISLNVNKNVKYSPDLSTVADEGNSYCLFAYGATPQPSNTEVRVACMSLRVRVWFTDD